MTNLFFARLSKLSLRFWLCFFFILSLLAITVEAGYFLGYRGGQKSPLVSPSTLFLTPPPTAHVDVEPATSGYSYSCKEGIIHYLLSEVAPKSEGFANARVREIIDRSLIIGEGEVEMRIRISQDAEFAILDDQNTSNPVTLLEGDNFDKITPGMWVSVSGLRTDKDGILIGSAVTMIKE